MPPCSPSKCGMQHQCDTPLPASVLWTWLIQEVFCGGSSFPPLLQGEKGRNHGEGRLRASGNDSCLFPTTGETTAYEQPTSLRENIQLEQNSPSVHGWWWVLRNEYKKEKKNRERKLPVNTSPHFSVICSLKSPKLELGSTSLCLISP